VMVMMMLAMLGVILAAVWLIAPAQHRGGQQGESRSGARGAAEPLRTRRDRQEEFDRRKARPRVARAVR